MGQRPRVWKGVGQDGYGLGEEEVDGGAALRREVGQESHNAAGARGNFGRGIAPPTKQFLHVFTKAGRAGGCMVLGAWASSLRLTQHLRAGFLAATQLGALDVRARRASHCRELGKRYIILSSMSKQKGAHTT